MQSTQKDREEKRADPGEIEEINSSDPTPRLSIKKTTRIISNIPIKTGTASVFSRNGCRGRFIMSEVGAADRERLLRSKRSELRYINYALPMARKRRERRIDAYIFHGADPNSGIVTSRKRKLREFFAVCDNEGPLPQISLANIDAPPTSAAEKEFLDVSDILLYV